MIIATHVLMKIDYKTKLKFDFFLQMSVPMWAMSLLSLKFENLCLGLDFYEN